MIHAFPKIFALGTDYIKDIFLDEVEITEKIDGSQFNFGRIDGELFMRSKGKQQYKDNPDKMFDVCIEYVLTIEDKILDNMTFYCEYLKNPRHNILKYERVPKHNLILFGASTTSESFVKEWRKFADIFDIEAVPILSVGQVKNIEEVQDFLDRDSVLGGTKVEGFVVKNYSRPFLLGGQPIPLMAGKFVSERFKETHRENWGKEYSTKGKWLTFLGSFNTEARWEKSIQRLDELGELENSPRDIGRLLKGINEDIESEEKQDVMNFLWKENKRQIFSSATKGFPEWYKERLLKRSEFPDQPQELLSQEEIC